MNTPFDINAASLELKNIQTEIDRVQKILRDLKTRKTNVLDKIQLYLNQNEHQGVIINNMEILSVTTVKTKPLTKKEKEAHLKNVLKQYTETPETINSIMNELTDTKKIAKQTQQQKIVIKKQ
jgi:hypothetical protein